MGQEVAGRSGAQAVERAIKVIDCFGDGDLELTLSETARQAELPVSTTYRIIQALVRGGLLERQTRDRYRVGTGLAALARPASARLGVDEAAPHLYALAAGIKLTVSLGIAHDHEILTVLSARPPVRWCTHQIPDPREPLHATAMGKTVMAFVPEGPRVAAERLGALDPFTGRTHTSPTDLLADLDEVRRRGFAVSDEERTDGVRAVAVPVFAAGHKMVGAMGVQALSKRLTDELIRDIVPALWHFAGEAGRCMAAGA
jgi:DNA-binding IclR family transcriptional regulator